MSDKKEQSQILRHIPEEIVGERLCLRSLRDEDASAVYEAIDESRAQLMPWLPFVTPEYDLREAETFVRRSRANWILRKDLGLGIWRHEDGRYLGGTGLHRIDWEIPHFEIGYWLRTSEEGKGYMTETVKLLAKTCFETLGANRLEIRCDTLNRRSAAVPRRIGFVHEATLRNHSRTTTGELRDTHIFALTLDDYACLSLNF